MQTRLVIRCAIGATVLSLCVTNRMAHAQASAARARADEKPQAVVPPEQGDAAKPSNPDRLDARERFEKGAAQYARGHYEEAVTRWTEAFRLDPRPRIQFNLAQAYERLGRLPEAADALTRYLVHADGDDAYRSIARSRLRAIKKRLANTGLELRGEPDDATVRIDGESVGTLSTTRYIALQPGNHRVLVRADGCQAFVSDVVVPAGQRVEVAVEMRPVVETDEAPAQPITKPASAPSHYADEGTGQLPWILASGALAAGTAGALAWYFERASAIDDCSADNAVCMNEGTLRTERDVALFSSVALGAGAVATLVTGMLLGSSSSHGEEQASRCAIGVAGIHCRARF